MQVAGKKIVTRLSQRVSLARGDDKVAFTLTALPLGWEDQTEKKLGMFPVPPRRVVMNADKTAVIDPTTRKALVEEDYGDIDYRSKRDEYTNRFLALKFRELVSRDPEVTFDCKEPVTADAKGWAAYADALLAELSDFMSKAELTSLCEFGDLIASAIDLKAAVSDFLSSRAGATESPPKAS